MINKFKSFEKIIFDEKKPSFIRFKAFDKYSEIINHGFSTRLGGVSEGTLGSLNLSFGKTDIKENVVENYNIVCSQMEIDKKSLVFSRQVHEDTVRTVSKADLMEVLTEPSRFGTVDALATMEKGITLTTFYADCISVLFFDRIKKVVASAHSGWKGTILDISIKTLEHMKKEFGCSTQDVEVVIGPSIRQCCFEVGEEVKDQFIKSFSNVEEFVENRIENKYYINLQGIISRQLVSSGIKPENIDDCEICTKCNKDLFHSHRGDEGKGGTMAAFIQLR